MQLPSIPMIRNGRRRPLGERQRSEIAPATGVTTSETSAPAATTVPVMPSRPTAPGPRMPEIWSGTISGTTLIHCAKKANHSEAIERWLSVVVRLPVSATALTTAASSIELEAAVHVDDLAGDEAGERRGKEAHGVGDLLGLAEPVDRDGRELGLALLLGQLLGHHRRHDVGRRDAVDGDAERRGLLGDGEGQSDQAGLRGGIGGARGQATRLPGEGRDVDDAAPALRLEMGQDLLAEQEGAVEVDRQHAAPFLD